VSYVSTVSEPPVRAKQDEVVAAPARRFLRSPPSWAVWSLLAVAGLLVWGWAVSFPFVWDDTNLIVKNPYLRHRGFLWQALQQDFWTLTNSPKPSGMYRPLVLWSYWLELRLWGPSPAGFHLTGVLLHLGNTGLVLALARRLGFGRGSAVVAALLFLFHPVQIEAVANIASRADLLASAGLLLGTLGWLGTGWQRWAAPLGLLFGMLSKESALVGPVLAVVAYATRADRPWVRSKGEPPWWLPVLAWLPALALRFQALGWQAYRALVSGQSEGGYRLLRYLLRVLLPWPQAPYTEVTHPGPVWVVVTSILAALLVVLVVRLAPLLRLGLLWVVMALLPVCELFPVGARFADLLLYLPMVGVALVAAWLTQWCARPGVLGGRAVLVFGPLLLGCVYGSVRGLPHWSSELALWRHGLRLDPDHPTMNLNLATALRRSGDPAAGCRHLERTRRTLRQRPNRDTEVKVVYNLGNCELERGRAAAALKQYQLAYRLSNGETHQALHNAVLALIELGRLEEAASNAQVLTRSQPQLADSWELLGVAYARQRKFGPATQAFARALAIEPDPRTRQMWQRATALARAVPPTER
jgi:hypothetical protein